MKKSRIIPLLLAALFTLTLLTGCGVADTKTVFDPDSVVHWSLTDKNQLLRSDTGELYTKYEMPVGWSFFPARIYYYYESCDCDLSVLNPNSIGDKAYVDTQIIGTDRDSDFVFGILADEFFAKDGKYEDLIKKGPCGPWILIDDSNERYGESMRVSYLSEALRPATEGITVSTAQLRSVPRIEIAASSLCPNIIISQMTAFRIENVWYGVKLDTLPDNYLTADGELSLRTDRELTLYPFENENVLQQAMENLSYLFEITQEDSEIPSYIDVDDDEEKESASEIFFWCFYAFYAFLIPALMIFFGLLFFFKGKKKRAIWLIAAACGLLTALCGIIALLILF